MESLAAQESQLWQDVINLIEQKSGKPYDQAVEHLLDLRDLAQHQGQQPTFQAHLNKILPRLSPPFGFIKTLA